MKKRRARLLNSFLERKHVEANMIYGVLRFKISNGKGMGKKIEERNGNNNGNLRCLVLAM